jgi:hypothetical protein
MSSWSWKAGLASIGFLAATAYAVAQMSGHPGMHGQMGPGGPDQSMMPQGGMHGQMHARMMQMMKGGMMHDHAGMHGAMAEPTMPGQDAFGTIQEVVQILEADPKTDWSKVNIAALREHLIDMNELTLHATAAERVLDNGIEIAVTGQGRTLDAIKRMVPAHAGELANIGWNAKTEDLPNGVNLIVTTNDPKQVTKLKALGFMGIMVQGAHHQPHHLMMAKGEFPMH